MLELFNKHKVRYCIVGAFAIGFHAIPRYTKDLDILVEPDLNNGQKIVEVLQEFGFGSLSLTAADFSRPGMIIQLGHEPVRIDLITSIPGCDFEEVWRHKARGPFGVVTANYIGRQSLLRNKRAVGRPQDLADVEKLQRVGRSRGKKRSR